MRREYSTLSLSVNERTFNRIIIDPHVDKHADHIDDELIIQLIYKLRARSFIPIRSSDGFEYYVTRINWMNLNYKLVWITQINQDFIGVITAFRDRRIK